MLLKTVTLFISLLSLNSLFSQVEEGKRITKELCSENYFGRGYIKSGDSLAAEFLAKEFEKRGLKKLKKSWFQNFEFDVNTFPTNMEMKMDEKMLVPGEDFMVDPSSGSSKQTLKYKLVNRNDLKNPNNITRILDEVQKDNSWNAVLFDCTDISKDTLNEIKIFSEYYLKSVDVIIVTNEKFTFSVSSKQYNHALIFVQSKAFKKDSEIETNIVAKLKKNHQARNVIAYLPAKKRTKKTLFLTAHYDHLGGMGNQTFFPGGNDNASGTSMLLTLADEFAIYPLKYNLVFIAFAGEEAGLLGSKYFVENPLVKLKHIKFVQNLDIMGSGEDGITVVNATIFPEIFDRLNAINEKEKFLTQIKKRGKAANSDHYWFSEKGIPAFFIYTMGPNKNYHDVFDTYEALSFNEYNDLVKLLGEFLRGF
ncbi:MAG: M28 family peptidase [Bacteroidota bacterium]